MVEHLTVVYAVDNKQIFFFEICFKNAKRLIAFGAVDTIPNKEILCLKYALKML